MNNNNNICDDDNNIVRGRVWRPKVEILANGPAQGQKVNSNLFATAKTSLIANSPEFDSIKQYNKQVLIATQSFNSSPKPFSRTASIGGYSKNNNNNNNSGFGKNLEQTGSQQFAASPSMSKSNQFNSPAGLQATSSSNKFCSQLTTTCAGASRATKNSLTTSSKSVEHISSEENMMPKLVHKQYNSPIDLYSMNNIRKTIEAHTELIAPGIKGINFMKPDTPVNKQSEVYKLVMEEESKQRASSASGGILPGARLSPISGQPISMPSGLIQTQQQQQYSSTSLNEQQQHQASQAKATCCECGQFISGPFARLQNKYIHAQCFNCTTCGTSLKNLGYFTVNEKLYCEIHAKQVASIMRINYDFSSSSKETEEQQQRSAHLEQHHQNQQQQPQHEASSSKTGDTRVSQQHQINFNQNSSVSSATISTMFAKDRSRNTISSEKDMKTNWSWRPQSIRDQTAQSSAYQIGTSGDAVVGRLGSTSVAEESRSTSCMNQIQQQQQQQQQQMGTRGRSLLQDSSQIVGGRIPICLNCQQTIHGPYILAGKTTWCKSCSQNEFNCTSCRRSLLNIGFIELETNNDDLHGLASRKQSTNNNRFYCEQCFEAYHAPICSKCNIRIKGDCLNALNKQWHPSCFICGHCQRPFGNSSFYLEDSVPYCERDWNLLFTTKCHHCLLPIQAGDKWIEALDRNYHSNCFKCSYCQANLEGSTFYCKSGKPYCKLHAR